MCILVLKYGRCYFDWDFVHIVTRKFIHLHDECWVVTLCVGSSGFLFLPMDALISGIPRFQCIRKRVIACYFLDKI